AQVVAATSLGLLAKLSTPLYTAAPIGVAIAVSAAARRRLARPNWWLDFRFIGSAALAAILAYATAAWYQVNFEQAWQHARASANATYYGSRRPFFGHLSFWLQRFGDA